MKNLVDVHTFYFAKIPCLIFTPKLEYSYRIPTLLYYYGWASKKEKQLFLCSLVSSFGYQVVVPDLPLHGERGELDYHSKEGSRHQWDIIIKAVKESNFILESLEISDKKININTDRIGVMGFSMGGFIASSVFANNPIFKCLININGSAAWEETVDYYNKLNSGIKINDDILTEIRLFDPINHIHRMYPRPILFLHGQADSIVPVFAQRSFYNIAISKYYISNQDLITLDEITKVGHYIEIGMLEKVINWIKNHL